MTKPDVCAACGFEKRAFMKDYYRYHHTRYHEKTFHIDPSSFLEPLVRYLKPGDALFDVGCGSGRDILWLKEQGFKVTGFERSEGLAVLARKHTGCEIIEGDFEVFDFSKKKFDAVLLSGALVHIPHRRLEVVFLSIVRALGKGGKVLISLKEGRESSMDQYGRIFYLWQDRNLRDVFSRHDFRVLDFHRGVSKVNEKDRWLSYVLTRGTPRPEIYRI